MHPLLLDIPSTLESDRLSLRAYGPGDGPWYYAMVQRNRAHLAEVMPDFILNVQNEEEAEILMRRWAADWSARNRFCIGVWEKASTEFAAEIYIQAMDWEVPVVELGYFADIDHEGKGIVTEAVKLCLGLVFETMGTHKVILTCDDANTKSHQVAERCGFVREGVLREQKRRQDGSFAGTVFYGMLRGEYAALRP